MFRSLVRAAGAAVRLATATTFTARVLPLTNSALCCSNALATRPFTRSLWMMGKNGVSSGYRPKLFSSRVLSLPLSCGCGGLHTDGDKAFSDFLVDEIKEERKIQKSVTLPKMSGGWELEMNGTEAKLIRIISGDKVTVKFNVNNSIPPNHEEEDQGQQKTTENEPELLSTPNFVVEVVKESTKDSLVFDCHYPDDETPQGEGEDEKDIFAIREVSFQPKGEAEWKETSYTLNTDSLDWALYDHLMDFLGDRGVDNTFADELIELSTAVEHQEYIKFLEELNGFVKCS